MQPLSQIKFWNTVETDETVEFPKGEDPFLSNSNKRGTLHSR